MGKQGEETDELLEEVFRRFNYDEKIGLITYAVSVGGSSAGDQAGKAGRNGIRTIKMDRAHFPAHRVAWALHNGEWPQGEVQHINGLTSDNRAENLRLIPA